MPEKVKRHFSQPETQKQDLSTISVDKSLITPLNAGAK
jgi:hypothetical protein